MSPSRTSAIQWDAFHNIIDGKQRSASEQHHGVNPSTGKQLWPVPIGGQQDVNDAVAAADKAFESWSQLSVAERKTYLKKFRDLYLAHAEDLRKLLSEETGKPEQAAKIESYGAVGWFDFPLSIDLPEERVEDDDRIVITRYTPLGVVGAICPWNFPILLSVGKIVPALMAGNTVIVKPSPYTPYTTLKVVELAQEVLPPGVLQAIGGDDRLGPMLTAHPGIAKISFTGSSATGRRVMAACAATLKRVTLELGGNDAAIVLPDVDIPKTAQELVEGAFVNSGQVCVATKRIYIHRDIYQPLVQEMVRITKTLAVGDPASGATHGPVQNQMQYEKVKDLFEDSKKNGYTFAAGSAEIPKGPGFFLTPTIIDNPPHDSRIVQEEPFGPIVPTQIWGDEEDVIRRANSGESGLAACVYGKDVAHAERIGQRLQAGSVFINSYEKLRPQTFFGGHKASGIGGEWGVEGLKSYCNAQVMHIIKQK